VITPVGAVRGAQSEWIVGNGEPGPVTARLRADLVGIQSGTAPDRYGWMHTLG
jgi:branched-chain amino acid aminotransferase